MRRASTHRRAGHTGFTMIEILLAMGIFALGFIAVAAIFPAGNVMQQATMNDIVPSFVVPYAETVVKTASLSTSNIPSSAQTSEEVVALSNWEDKISLYDRGFPTMWGSTSGGDTKYGTAKDKDYYWIPLVKYLPNLSNPNADPPALKYRAYLVVLDGRSGVQYDQSNSTFTNPNDPADVPGLIRVTVGAKQDESRITNAPSDLGAGDIIITVSGDVLTVVERNGTELTLDGQISAKADGTDPDAIWYAPPAGPGRRSPALAVGTSTIAVTGQPCRFVIDMSVLMEPEHISGTCPIDVSALGAGLDLEGTWSPGGGTPNYAVSADNNLSDVWWCNCAGSVQWRPIMFVGNRTTKNLPDGNYTVYATWPFGPGNTPDARYTVWDGDVLAGGVNPVTVLVNQTIAPKADLVHNGRNWERLGSFPVTAGRGVLSFTIDNMCSTFVVFDAIIVETP